MHRRRREELSPDTDTGLLLREGAAGDNRGLVVVGYAEIAPDFRPADDSPAGGDHDDAWFEPTDFASAARADDWTTWTSFPEN